MALDNLEKKVTVLQKRREEREKPDYQKNVKGPGKNQLLQGFDG